MSENIQTRLRELDELHRGAVLNKSAAGDHNHLAAAHRALFEAWPNIRDEITRLTEEVSAQEERVCAHISRQLKNLAKPECNVESVFEPGPRMDLAYQLRLHLTLEREKASAIAEMLQTAYYAIEQSSDDAFGYGESEDGAWPLKLELLSNMEAALTAYGGHDG